MKLNLIFLSFLCLFSCTQMRNDKGELALPDSLQHAINSSDRTEENEERDEFQHPLETLQFFGLKPEMTVVEITPGSGYYTEILAPYLAKNGQYIIVTPRLPSHPPAFMLENEKKIQNILLKHSEVLAKTRIIPFEPISQRNKSKIAFADMVLTFTSVHNWVANNSVSTSFKFFHDILKPGGILGVVQHRKGQKDIPKSGYMSEREVMAMAQKAGFKLVEKSEINANRKDTADYPEGVWTLPPIYRLGDKDRRKYESIGESDRMTLKFIKI